jgi:hypothetical protein
MSTLSRSFRKKGANTRKGGTSKNNFKPVKSKKRKALKSKLSKRKKGAGVNDNYKISTYFSEFNRPENRETRARNKLRKEIEKSIIEKERLSDDRRRKKDKFYEEFKTGECSICLEDIDDDKNKSVHQKSIEKCLSCLDKKNKKLYFTDCEHTFHGRCLDIWLQENNECPLCRKEIIDLHYYS